MLEAFDMDKVLFLDIETVSSKPTFAELDEDLQPLWRSKARQLLRKPEEELEAEEVADYYKERAAIYAEFGKIICISVGVVYRNKDKRLKVRLKSFASDDEAQLLTEFSQLLNQHYKDLYNYALCGHNIREFDIPYVCRRMIINQLPLPAALQIAGKKPWETKHLLDTMEFWKFGDYKNYTSLKLLAAVLGFPSPKDDIDGSNVGRVYWEENDLDRIAVYCEKDVLATVQLYCRYRRMPLLEEDQVDYVRNEEKEE
ncbi:MAG: 3'-5' exonuclease [Saprospiraceae bacterium]|nr:MAG: 3'-5' exonuclease [Saprospiraceae bacterium]